MPEHRAQTRRDTSPRHRKRLKGLLSICASCKKTKDEHGSWQPLESYIQALSEAKFTHGLCPECLQKLYPDYYHQ
jgi:hypothetical protein